MPEADAPTVVILLWSAVGLLVILLLLVVAVFRRLSRIERRLIEDSGRQDVTEAAATESQPGGAFEMFLNEDPAHRELPKREQFAAYRQWRHERGMNWSNS